MFEVIKLVAKFSDLLTQLFDVTVSDGITFPFRKFELENVFLITLFSIAQNNLNFIKVHNKLHYLRTSLLFNLPFIYPLLMLYPILFNKDIAFEGIICIKYV